MTLQKEKTNVIDELFNSVLALCSYGLKKEELYVSMDYNTLMALAYQLSTITHHVIVLGDKNPFDNAMVFGVKIIPSPEPLVIRVFNYKCNHISKIEL